MIDIDDPVYEEAAAKFGNAQHTPEWARRACGPDQVAKSVVVDVDGVLATPLLVSENQLGLDVCTPWGFGLVIGDGGVWSWREMVRRLRAAGVISAYLRVRAPRVATMLTHDTPELTIDAPIAVVPAGQGKLGMNRYARRDVRRLERAGWQAKIVERPNRDWWAEFVAIHDQTMDRLAATAQYRLGAEDYEWANGPWRWFGAEARLDGRLGAGAVMVRGPHETVGVWAATAHEHLSAGPYKAALAAALESEAARGIDLGPAMDEGDSGQEFKRRMGAEMRPAIEARLVVRKAEFDQLAQGTGGGYFPPWRKEGKS